MATAVAEWTARIHDESGNRRFRSTGRPEVEVAFEPQVTTPQDIIEHLMDSEGLPRVMNGERVAHSLLLGNTELVPDRPLGGQGVVDGATLGLHSKMKEGSAPISGLA